MADETSLLIRIKTVLEEQGIKLTEQSLQRVVERTQQLSQRTSQATGDFKGFTAAQKEQAQALVRTIEAKEQAARSAQNLSRDVRSATGAFNGLRNIVGGALNGNLAQLGQGLGQISNASLGASKGMQSLFAQFARGGAAGAVVAAPALIAIQALKAEAADAEATMKRWWDNAAKAAEAYRQRHAEITAAAAQDLAKLRAEVARTAAEYDALLGRMDASARRADELAAAQKELELAQAKTPEERAAIEARYGATGLANDAGRADLQIRNAEEAEAQARQNIRDAEAQVRDAEAAFSASPSKEGRAAINAAKANLAKVQEDASPVFQRAAAQIEQARHTKQVAAVRSQTFGLTTAQSTAEATDPERRAELRRTAQAAMERGDYTTQDRAVAELRKLDSAAKTLTKAVIETGATTSSALEAAAKDLQKQKERQANLAESKAGS